MATRTHVVGVGMTPFRTPHPDNPDYPELAQEAARAALADAGLDYAEVEQVVCGYVYGESTCGQRAVYPLGLSGVPVFNVNNNCATGSSALLLARQLVAGGGCDLALALGFERMTKGTIPIGEGPRTSPLDPQFARLDALRGPAESPPAPRLFGEAAQEHMERYGSTPAQFAQVAVKNRRHAEHNPRAQQRTPCSLDEVLASRPIHGPLTKLQCCRTSDGAAAALVASESWVRRRGLSEHAVELLSLEMVTDLPSTFAGDVRGLVGIEMTATAAARAYEAAGVGPAELDVIELHDCFTAAELIAYEGLGLCPAGAGGELVASGAVSYGGRWVVNPSGGLLAKGHPLGATGLAQCCELTWQLRGEAGPRQVEGARLGLQHNMGLGGCCVVGVYRAPEA